MKNIEFDEKKPEIAKIMEESGWRFTRNIINCSSCYEIGIIIPDSPDYIPEFTVNFDKTVHGFIDDIRYLADDFDPDHYVREIIEMYGVWELPEKLQTLLNDSKDLQIHFLNLANALEKWYNTEMSQNTAGSDI